MSLSLSQIMELYQTYPEQTIATSGSFVCAICHNKLPAISTGSCQHFMCFHFSHESMTGLLLCAECYALLPKPRANKRTKVVTSGE